MVQAAVEEAVAMALLEDVEEEVVVVEEEDVPLDSDHPTTTVPALIVSAARTSRIP